MPMKLSVKYGTGGLPIFGVFSYKPGEKTWWITGWNPNFRVANANDLTAIISIDFSSNQDMYKAFRDTWKVDPRWSFDDKNHTAKFTWYTGNEDVTFPEQ